MDDEGNVTLDGSFSVCFHYYEKRASLPFLGVVHNDQADCKKSVHAVEEIAYVFSNVNLSPVCPPSARCVPDALEPLPAHAWIPSTETVQSAVKEKDRVADYMATYQAATKFQSDVAQQVWGSFKDASPDLDIHVDYMDLYCCNIWGMRLPKTLVSINVTVPTLTGKPGQDQRIKFAKAREQERVAKKRANVEALKRALQAHSVFGDEGVRHADKKACAETSMDASMDTSR